MTEKAMVNRRIRAFLAEFARFSGFSANSVATGQSRLKSVWIRQFRPVEGGSGPPGAGIRNR